VDRSWEYINRSQTHECGNWEIGTEAAQSLFWGYINGIFVAVCFNNNIFDSLLILFARCTFNAGSRHGQHFPQPHVSFSLQNFP
jgi:hypothetical protein